MNLQHDLVAKVAKTKLTYITLTKVKQSRIKTDQILTTHCNITEIKGTEKCSGNYVHREKLITLSFASEQWVSQRGFGNHVML